MTDTTPTRGAFSGRGFRGRGRGGNSGSSSAGATRPPPSPATTQAVAILADASLPPAEAAKALAAPAVAAHAKPEAAAAGEAALWDLWNGVVEAAARTPHAEQGRVVDVVAAIKGLGGPPFEVWGERLGWGDLPLLGPALRERWDDDALDRVGLNAFAARLTAAEVADFSLYGVWTLRGALEAAGTAGLTEVPAAAAWFVYAGEKIRAWCKEGRAYEGRVAIPGEAVAGREWKGYDEERWKFWVEQWRKVKDDGVTPQSKGLVEEATKEIERLS